MVTRFIFKHRAVIFPFSNAIIRISDSEGGVSIGPRIFPYYNFPLGEYLRRRSLFYFGIPADFFPSVITMRDSAKFQPLTPYFFSVASILTVTRGSIVISRLLVAEGKFCLPISWRTIVSNQACTVSIILKDYLTHKSSLTNPPSNRPSAQLLVQTLFTRNVASIPQNNSKIYRSVDLYLQYPKPPKATPRVRLDDPVFPRRHVKSRNCPMPTQKHRYVA